MDHTISTRWGGRAWRYVEFRGAVGRCFDPYGRQPVEFEFAYEYEAWLRWRFDPNTLSISPKSLRLAASINGRPLTALPTFVVIDRARRLHYHLALGKGLQEKRTRDLVKVAAITGGRVCVTTRTDLRMDVGLFWRLELLRQASQLHEGQGADIDCEILTAVRSGASTRDGVCSTLAQHQPQLILARLGHLHCSGSLVLKFHRDNFEVKPIEGVESCL